MAIVIGRDTYSCTVERTFHIQSVMFPSDFRNRKLLLKSILQVHFLDVIIIFKYPFYFQFFGQKIIKWFFFFSFNAILKVYLCTIFNYHLRKNIAKNHANSGFKIEKGSNY